MGCCGSKIVHDEDDVSQPLLNEDTRDNRMNYQTYETIDVQKEQEFWNNIIDRTTQNLIDISSSQTEPLQENDIQDRERKYKKILEQLNSKKTVATTSSSSISIAAETATKEELDINLLNATALDLINNSNATASATTTESGEFDWIDQSMQDIRKALDQMQIKPVGDIVVHLTPPSSAPGLTMSNGSNSMIMDSNNISHMESNNTMTSSANGNATTSSSSNTIQAF